MPAVTLNKKMNVEIKVRLISKGNDEPVNGKEFSVRLYDKDVFNNDFLGEAVPNEEGVAKFILSQKDFTGNLGLDDKPDFYFLVYKNEKEIFRSKVMSNLDLSNLEQFIMKEGQVIDLGTFLVDTQNS